MNENDRNRQKEKGEHSDKSEMHSERGQASNRESAGSNAKSQAGTAGAAVRHAPGSGESTASDAYKNETGDPGLTPGSAEGVEDFQKTGNE